MITTESLTTQQRKFLESYLPYILHGGNADIAHSNRAEFVLRVTGMDFDDSEDATPGERRVASSLKKYGLISELDIHQDVFGGWHIYLIFSEAGANALFEINRNRLSGPTPRGLLQELGSQ